MSDEILDALRRLGDAPALAVDVAARVAPRLDTLLQATTAAGAAPDGKPWAPRKAGGRAYAGAASHVEVKALGAYVRATVTGPEAWGHLGAGMAVRLMVPDGGAAMPEPVARILDDAMREVIER